MTKPGVMSAAPILTHDLRRLPAHRLHHKDIQPKTVPFRVTVNAALPDDARSFSMLPLERSGFRLIA